MKFTCSNIFNCDAETYWTKVFFDADYNTGLYMEGLNFKGFELLEVTGEPGGDRTRRIRTEPRTQTPAVIEKLIGGSITYTESGRLDAKSGKWKFEITTSKLSDKISIGGTLWVEPRGDKKIERFCETNIEVKIFGVGGTIEKFVADTTRESYDKTERFTNEWLKKKGY
jgi:hypothetical protein